MNRAKSFGIAFAFLVLGFATGLAQESDQITDVQLAGAKGKFKALSPNGHQNGRAHARHGIPNIDSLVNFNGQFFADGYDSNDNPNRHWYYNMVGNPPHTRARPRSTRRGSPITRKTRRCSSGSRSSRPRARSAARTPIRTRAS